MLNMGRKKGEKMDNVIHVDFQSGSKSAKPIKVIKKKKKKAVLKSSSHNNVHNISFIHDKASEDRRKKRRIIVSGLMNAAIVHSKGLIRDVFIYDISREGMSFDLPQEYNIKKDEELHMRLYLNSVDFFEFTVLVKNKRPVDIEDFHRYGTIFRNLNTDNKKAIINLVSFIESASSVLNKDRGEVLFSV